MQSQLITAMQNINSQIKALDSELDYIVISELRRQRFFIICTYKYLHRYGYFSGSQTAVKSMPENRNMEVSNEVFSV